MINTAKVYLPENETIGVRKKLNPSSGLKVAIVGATGAVGKTLLNLFDERQFNYEQIWLIASSRSVGKIVTHRGVNHKICDLETFDFQGIDLVFCSAGSTTSRQWGRKIADQGPVVIDNTNAFRMEPDVPLIVPQVNGKYLIEHLDSHIIANPNCTTIPMVRALYPVHQEYRLEKVIVSTYQAASGGGVTGLEQFTNGSKQILDDPDAIPEAGRFQTPLPFNLVPSIDILLDSGFTLEEQKITQESRKIMSLPDIKVSATAVRVPVMNCHSQAVYFECASHMEYSRLMTVLDETEGIMVYRSADAEAYPTPRRVSGSDDVHVGRVRIDSDNDKAGWMWVVSDNLRVGAALNAIQIAEELIHSESGLSCQQPY